MEQKPSLKSRAVLMTTLLTMSTISTTVLVVYDLAAIGFVLVEAAHSPIPQFSGFWTLCVAPKCSGGTDAHIFSGLMTAALLAGLLIVLWLIMRVFKGFLGWVYGIVLDKLKEEDLSTRS